MSLICPHQLSRKYYNVYPSSQFQDCISLAHACTISKATNIKDITYIFNLPKSLNNDNEFNICNSVFFYF